MNPCQPSPCGPNSQCKQVNDQAVCSCLPTFIGNPPNCRPECIVSTECSADKACINNKCENPCTGSCGLNALCNVINHSPICSCEQRYTGDPFTRCFPIPRKIRITKVNALIIKVFFSNNYQHPTRYQFQLLNKTPACHRLVDLILNVGILVVIHLVLVYQITKECRLIVDQNVLLIPNALAIQRVLIKSVEILVQARVEQVPFVM